MPGTNVRVGGARIDISANDAQYQAAVGRVIASQRRLGTAFTGSNRGIAQNNKAVTQLTTSMRSAVISAVALGVGIQGINRVVGGSTRSFIEWERGLVAVQKTTDLLTDRPVN